MSSKQLLRLAGALAVVLVLWGAVALASRNSDGGSEQGRILPEIDTAAVDSIVLSGPGDTIFLVRAGKGRAEWQVNGKAADAKVVADLLGALKESRSSAELVARNPASHARFRITQDSAKHMRVVQGGRTNVTLLAGKQSSEWDGIYLRRAGEPAVYVVRGGLAPALTRSPEDWRDHTIARITPDSVAAIEVRRGRSSYTLRRQSKGWVFGSGRGADSAAVANLLSRYREIKAAGFGSKAQLDSLRFDRSRRTARLLDQGGQPMLGLVFDSIASGTWVRLSEDQSGRTRSGEAYRIDNWTADQLTPPDSTLRKK
jgi:hypothetical protein